MVTIAEDTSPKATIKKEGERAVNSSGNKI